MKVLGIDPGSSRIGYGLIEKQSSQLKFLKAGTLEIKESDPNQKLFYLAQDFEKILKETKPDLVAVEKLYFTKNVKTGIEVAQARGVIIFLIFKYFQSLTSNFQTPLIEMTPQQAKAATTNYGAADKKAVARMVALILNEPDFKGLDDATDALALAIAAASLKRGLDS